MRLFIALNLEPETREYLSNIQDQFREYGSLACPEPGNMHLTLKFLGKVNEQEAEKVKEALMAVPITRLTLSLSSLGVFPNENYVRVLWAGFEKSRELSALKHEIDKAIPGFKDDKPFAAHLTLARVKTLKDKQGFTKALHETKLEPLKSSITGFTLYESRLTPQGPVYALVEEYS